MRCWVALAFASVLGAQTGSISGIVRDGSTGNPLSECRVAGGGMWSHTAADGAYSLDRLSAGQVELLAVCAQGTARQSIVLRGGEARAGMDLRVATLSSISGRVLDANGDPVPGVRVALRRREYSSGILRYFPNGDVATDQDGGFELQAEPGRSYLLEAYPPLNITADAKPAVVDPKDRPLELPHTYYPGSPNVDEALPVTPAAGESRSGVDIRTRKLATYCVEGAIDVAGNPSAVQYVVRLEDGEGREIRDVDSGMSAADGKFHNCGLFAGTYRIAPGSATRTDAGRLGGVLEVAIRDGDVHGLRLAAQPVPPVTFEKTSDVEPGNAKTEPQVNIRLIGVSEDFQVMLSAARAGTSRQRLLTLPASDFGVHLGGLTGRYYLKDLLINGVNSLRKPVLNASAILGGARVRFVIANDGGSISGAALDQSGNPSADVNIVLIPENAMGAIELSEAISTTLTDRYGVFQSAPLAPGKYQVLATPSAIVPTPECMEKLRLARTSAVEVDLQPGGSATAKVIVSELR